MLKRRGLLAVLVASLSIGFASVSAQDTIVIRQLDNQVVQTPAWDIAIAAFEEANPGITIEREVISNVPEVLQFAFTGDNPPDIFVSNIVEADQMRSLVDSGYVYSLDQFSDWEEFRATFPNADLAVASGSNEFSDVVTSMKFDADLF
jgi:ABC-type glycerol-3-phosphate transport system substrate-binding protein